MISTLSILLSSLLPLLSESEMMAQGNDVASAQENVATAQVDAATAATEQVAVKTVSIDPAARLQPLEGWGVSLCWWANMCGRWDDQKLDEIVEWLVSPEGLNYNVFRYNIGGGDDPLNRNCSPHHMGKGKGLRAEMPGFKASAEADYDWSQDEAQRRVMLKIREKRPDAIFEAFSNTPPYYMTESGCCAGHAEAKHDNLRKECYEDFAQYLVDVCCHYKEQYGIEFVSLDPFNEPNTDYWYRSGSQEGCHFDVESQIALVKVLSPLLRSTGLHTMLVASDETNLGTSVGEVKAFMRDSLAWTMVDRWNVHTYGGDNGQRVLLDSLVHSSGKGLWMSETGHGGRGIMGNLQLARRLMDDMRLLRPSVWCDWQYVEEFGDQWCLVRGNFADQSYLKTRHYYVRQQFTRHIRQGDYFLATADSNLLAAVSPDGSRLTLVMINEERNAKEYQLKLTDASFSLSQAWRTSQHENHVVVEAPVLQDGMVCVEVPARSIVTVEVFLKGS